MKLLIINSLRILFLICISLTSFANSSEKQYIAVAETSSIDKNEYATYDVLDLELRTESFLNDGMCSVTCEVSWTTSEGDTYTFSTSAGGIFTSCDRAMEKCLAKLESIQDWD